LWRPFDIRAAEEFLNLMTAPGEPFRRTPKRNSGVPPAHLTGFFCESVWFSATSLLAAMARSCHGLGIEESTKWSVSTNATFTAAASALRRGNGQD